MFFFLRSGPLTAVGLLGIPVCTIAAFLGLLIAGRTINVISLAGVAFAIGMTLDNTIVVLEAIEQERRRGLARFEAALAGVRRVWSAVLASTLTTVLVFVPVLFVQQEAGQIYSDIAIAVSASIILSMAVAVTLVPAACARLRFVAGAAAKPAAAAGRAGGARPRGRVMGGLRWLLVSRPRRLACIALTVLVTGGALVVLTPPAEYLPEGEEAKTFSRLIAPPGYSLREMTRLSEEVHAQFLPHLRATPDAFLAGETTIPPIASFSLGVEPGSLRVVATTVDAAHIEPLMAAITTHFRSYPGMRAFSSRGSIISSNDGGTRSVNLDISGPELPAIYATALTAYRRAQEALESPQIGSSPSSLVLGQPLIEVRPRWERMAELGFTTQEFGYAVAVLADGAYADEFFLDDDKIDIFLYSRAVTDREVHELVDLPIFAPAGGVLPLGAVAEMYETVDTDAIRRVDGRRTVTLNIIPPRAIALETGVALVQEQVVGAMRASGEIPAAVTIELSGASDQLMATREALGANFIVSVVLCYLVLVVIFTHWGYPLLILISVPLGIAGGIIGLWLLNLIGGALPWVGWAAIRQPFDMITMLGFLILLGTVVNNPILIVDEARNRLREPGVTPRDAVEAAVESRLRPIMMSTITTVCGLMPLVLIPGAGTELYRGVGAVVLFGLLFAMTVTLTFLPSLLITVLEWGSRRSGALPPTAAARSASMPD
jgi:multidrug efflux pump subunit AcrB